MGLLDLCRTVSQATTVATMPARAPAGGGLNRSALVRRQQAAQVLTRYYQAAQDNRNTYGMAQAPISPDSLTSRTMRKLRARSRQESAINDFARRFLQLLDSNIVGPRGHVLRGQFLNSDGKLDGLANTTIEDAWETWGERCTIDGLPFLDVQSLTVRTTAVDGELFVREIINPRASTAAELYRLELVDPELLSVDDNRELSNGHQVRQGLEFNRAGLVVAYWFLDVDPGTDYLGQGYQGREAVRVPADQVHHIHNPERVGQHRGLPWTSTSLLRLAVLEGMEDAALIAARVGASKVGVFTREHGAQQFQGEGGNVSTGELFMEAEAGSFTELPPGVQLNSWDPTYPSGEFGPFTKAVLRGIASGLGVPYTSLSSDLEGVNYSSIRAGMLEARDIYKRQQEWLASRLLRPVYRRWLSVNLAAGTLVLPTGNALPLRKLDKFQRVEFQPPRWEWVDPLKETQAQDIAIARGTMTESEAIRRGGRDPEAVWQERARELKRKQELGLPLGPEVAQLVPVVEAPDNNTDGEE